MNVKTTLFLVVLLLAVAGFFFWIRQKNPGAPTPTSSTPALRAQGQPLWPTPPLAMEQIAAIQLVRGDQTLRFAKEGDDWWQVAPVRFALNAWSARDLMDTALNLRYVERFAPGGKDTPALADLSLQPPLATLTFSDAQERGKSITLHLGRTSVGGRGYLSLGQDATVYVVHNRLHVQLLEGDLLGYRKKTLNLPTFADIMRLSLQTPDGLVDTRKISGQWVFAGDHSGRADADALAGLVGSIGGLFIHRFVRDNPADISVYGLDRPHYQIALTTRPAESIAHDDAAAPIPEKTYRLRIGSPTDLSLEKFFATLTRDDADPVVEGLVVFEVGASDVEKLRKKVDDLRDTRLTTIRSSAVQGIRFTREDGDSILLAKSPEGWIYASPQPGYGLDRAEVLHVLDRWISARAAGFTGRPDADALPVYTAAFMVEEKDEPVTIKLHAGEDPDHWLVQVSDQTPGYLVPRSALPLIVSPLALRDRTVAAWNVSELQTLEINRPGKSTVLLQRSASSGAWELQSSQSHEPFAVDELARQLAPLKAHAWLEVPAADWDAEKNITLRIVLADGGQHLLWIDPASRHAQLDTEETGFIVRPELLTALQAEFARTSPAPSVEMEMRQK